MALSFANLKPAGIKAPSMKAFKMPSIQAPKVSGFTTQVPKIPGQKTLKSFNFSKLAKQPKIPKAPKIAVMKRAIKKNAGY